MTTAAARAPGASSAEALWRGLVEYARWAPSPHNIQPWRLRVRSRFEAELLCDRERLLPTTDPEGRFTACGLGIFAECLAIAAAAALLELAARYDNVRLDTRRAASEPFAVLALRPAAVAEPLDRDLLLARRTARGPYDGRPVEESVLRELEGIAAAYGHRLHVTSDGELVRWTVELNRDTLFLDMSDAGAREEVGRWLRYSGREAAERKDGFSPECLGFPGWLLRLFFRRHRLLELPLLHTLVRALYARTMRGTSTVAWLTGPFDEPLDCVTAGRMLARLWLTLTRHGVRLHPFGSIVTNPVANARLLARLSDDSSGTLWLIMRLGYAPEPPRSLRLDTEQLVVS